MGDEPTLEFDTEKVQEGLNYLNEYLETQKNRQQVESIQTETEQTTESKAAATAEDPRNADKWGAKALIKEGQSIIGVLNPFSNKEKLESFLTCA